MTYTSEAEFEAALIVELGKRMGENSFKECHRSRLT